MWALVRQADWERKVLYTLSQMGQLLAEPRFRSTTGLGQLAQCQTCQNKEVWQGIPVLKLGMLSRKTLRPFTGCGVRLPLAIIKDS